MGRGKQPKDAALFDAGARVALVRAANDLQWLYDRDYPPRASLALVGNRHELVARQREALQRGVCRSDLAEARARARVDELGQLDGGAGASLWIDGFNQVITVEAALAEGVLVRGVDGVLRDMSSVHGSYRRVAQTHEALARLVAAIEQSGAREVHWRFDRPVSNSGRVAAWVRELAPRSGLRWEVECVNDPDAVLAEAAKSGACVASSDAWILDALGPAGSHFALAEAAIADRAALRNCVDLRPGPEFEV